MYVSRCLFVWVFTVNKADERQVDVIVADGKPALVLFPGGDAVM